MKKNTAKIVRASSNLLFTKNMKNYKPVSTVEDVAYRLLVEKLEDYAIFMMDINGLITTWNKGAEMQFGYLEEEVLGKNFSLIFTEEDKRLGLPKKELNEAKKVGRADDERQHVGKDGKAFWCSGVVVKFEDENGKFVGLTKMVRDISERKKNEEIIQHQAMHDPLTGLANRRLLFEELAIAVASTKKNNEVIALAFIDLDKFKSINDTEGHDTADLLLKEVAIKLAGSVRPEDMVARFGGDEFIILLRGIKNAENAEKIIKGIVKSLEPTYEINNKQLDVKVSIGIALCPVDGKDLAHLIKNADVALYEAKKAGGNCYKFYTS